jgi:hypothetical protein
MQWRTTRCDGSETAVKAHAELVAKRTGGNAAEMGEIRFNNVLSTTPLIALPICEEEDAVAADRTAQAKTELLPLEERIGIRGVAVKSGMG